MPLIAQDKDNALSNDAIDQYIYNAIVDAILNRQLPPGTRLVEAPLCKAFGVTRGVLRRVFIKLAHDKVIEIQPNRGALISQHSVDETRAVFEARSMLEIGTVKKLALKADQIDLSKLKELVTKEAQVRSAGQWKEWIKLSGEFHIQLSEVNNNPIVTTYLQTLIARTSLLIGMYDMPKHNNCSVEEHSAILTAIEQGDAMRAIRLMEEHLEDYASIFLENKPEAQKTDLADIFKHKTLAK